MQSETLFFNAIGDIDSNRNDIFQTGKTFFAKLYGGKQMRITSMNELRFQLFTSRKAKAPAIKKLPPSDEALEQHLMRAHLQTMIWRAADQQGPPAVSFEITNFGWKVSDGIPHPITTLANIAPYELMQVVSCTCKVNNPCSRKNCSCAAAAVSCTNYCKCRADTQC